MTNAVLINVFEVPAGHDEEFLRGWQAARDVLRRQPGFVSARLHQSLDPAAAFRFVNVAEWASPEDFRRAVATPEFQELVRGMPFAGHPALYRICAE